MPKEYQLYGKQWVDLNPAWWLSTFHEVNVPVLLKPWPEIQEVVAHLYERDADRKGIELYVQMADIMGYVIIEAYGGIYINCDMQPLRSIPDLPVKAWASYENWSDGRIVNAAIGAPEAHNPFWVGLLEALPARYWASPSAEMVETTGPAFLTDHAHAHPDLIHVLPVESFNPIHWGDIPLGGDASNFSYPTEAIAVHHWGHKKDRRSNHVETATQ